MELKRTPLFEAHRRLGARLIDFGGWEMPVQYSGIVDEHLCVRRAAGIFDISHMGEVEVSGAGAKDFLNQLLTNDAARLGVGEGQYTLMCNPGGGVIDDLYLYRIGPERFLLIVNASRVEADVAYIGQQHADWPGKASVEIVDRSAELAAVAVQGPRVVEFIGEVFTSASRAGIEGVPVLALKKNQIGQFPFGADAVWIGRTGYTGEDGFEVVAPAALIEAVWTKLLAAGHAGCLQPCGLGSRDTLRTEMGYPLYGHELAEEITPIEAGLGYFVALDKPVFIGRETLLAQKTAGPPRKAIAFTMTDKSAPPRAHYPIQLPGESGAVIGEVTSGTQSPSLNCGIGLGLVAADQAVVGNPIAIEIRGRRFKAVIVKKPIYRKTAS
jgi:aminomethyltransferase